VSTIVKPNPTFIRRIYTAFRYSSMRVDVFVHPKYSDVPENNIPTVEISFHGSDQRHVTGHFTLEDGEALIEAIREAIEKVKGDAA
jgi:hypothetical protein